jgi:hypothetical protein
MTVIFLAAAIIVAMLVVEAMVKNPVFTAGVILGAVAFITFESGALPPVNVGGFTITTSDVVFSMVVTAGIARHLRMEQATTVRHLLALICVLTIVALVRGVQLYGPESAVREFRTFLQFFGATWYFSTVKPTSERLERIAKVWLVIAAVLVGIALMRWAALAAGLPPTGIFTREREVAGLRVIDNRSALIVAQALLMVLPLVLRKRASLWQRRLFFVFVPVLVVLQHRTIWLVLLLGGVLLLQRSGAVTTEKFAVILGLGAIVLTLLIMNPGLEQSSIVERSPVHTGSLEWRWNSWVALLSDETGGIEWVSGTPFGSGFERELNGVTVDIIPHNWYVEITYRLGIIGILPFIALYAAAIRRWRGGRNRLQLLDRQTMYVLLLTQLLYFMFWDPGPDQGILLGLTIVSSGLSRDEPAQDGERHQSDVTAVAGRR